MNNYRAELLAEHAAIEMLAARLSKLVGQDADAPELAQTFEHLAQAVAGHLAVEEEIIYDKALRAQPDVTENEVEQMNAEFTRLKADWGDHCRLWTAEQIRKDRRGFIRATQGMMPRLRDRVGLESKLLLLVQNAGPVARL